MGPKDPGTAWCCDGSWLGGGSLADPGPLNLEKGRQVAWQCQPQKFWVVASQIFFNFHPENWGR